MNPKLTKFQQQNTHRIIRSLYPTTGVFDDVGSPAELKVILDLEGWTNDRISAGYGVLHMIPESEWVVGTSMATIVMAAYCHPRPTGGRFTLPDRGAWYAAIDQQTAIRETIHHYTKELFDEIGVTETYVQVREYLADFDASFHDVRSASEFETCYASDDYEPGQQLGAALLRAGSNGLLYTSVRHPGHDCIVCFRPPLVLNVRQAAHFEYRWHGQREPEIRPLASG